MQIEIGSIVATKPVGGITVQVVTSIHTIGTARYVELVSEHGDLIEHYPVGALLPFKAQTVGENEREMSALAHAIARRQIAAQK